MTQEQVGQVHWEDEGNVCIITIDNVRKKNAYSPEMMDQLAQYLTDFEENDDLWVGIICSAGEDTTAGLDMPTFFGPKATAKPRPDEWVDPFGLKRRCTKPLIAVVQGITLDRKSTRLNSSHVATSYAAFCL